MVAYVNFQNDEWTREYVQSAHVDAYVPLASPERRGVSLRTFSFMLAAPSNVICGGCSIQWQVVEWIRN